MTALIRDLLPASRQVAALSVDDWAQMFSFGNFPLTLNTTLVGNKEEIEQTYEGLTYGAYRSNGIIFACVLARFMLFSEARFQFRQRRSGRPGDLFGTSALSLLEQPEPGKQTGDLLARAILDVDIGGNAFIARRPGRLKRLRPDWVSILLGSRNRNESLDPHDVDAEVVGYIYVPGGLGSGNEPQTFLPDEVAHWAPIPDPLASYRGMSWMLPVLREILSDSAATTHKQKFFENAATPNMIVTLDPKVTLAAAKEWIALFEDEHKGVMNAYKTAYLGGGASSEVVGRDFQQMDFKVVQGAGEVRIAAAAGVHPVVVGISEGLQGSALNSGNFLAARRLLGDRTMRPLWRGLSGSLETVTDVPSASQLWYDDRDIPFLAEDRKDEAEVLGKHAEAIVKLGNAGWEHESVKLAVVSGDLTLLRHTGMVSVQLQPPGSGPAIANQTFWPVTGIHAGRHIERGTYLDASDPLVGAFPHLFMRETIAHEPARLALPGPSHIVTVDQVREAQERLRAEGRPSGYDSLARELGVSRDTVRRRLNGS
jgi:hypothetical protein